MTGRGPRTYAIHVHADLDDCWSDWLDGLTITRDGEGTTISGPIIDQAHLHGVLARLRDMGAPLRWLRVIDPGSAG